MHRRRGDFSEEGCACTCHAMNGNPNAMGDSGMLARGEGRQIRKPGHASSQRCQVVDVLFHNALRRPERTRGAPSADCEAA
jgi:hypothetical protein